MSNNKNYKNNSKKGAGSQPLAKSGLASKKVRVRFAPSPTGFLHIGGARTALFNYLYAKQNKGSFILRIEDTDRDRFVPKATDDIIKSLEWLGIKYDEGVKIKSQILNLKNANQNLKLIHKGKYKPYVQSERLEIYRKHAEELVKSGGGYYCFCSAERLANLRKEQEAKKMPPMYDGKCRSLPEDEINEKLKIRGKYVIRQKVPKEGATEFNDIIRGNVKFENKLLDDSVLLKSDGYPTYHLANVVDDYLMKITHIIRAEEWLSSTPKHILLYKAFSFKIPEFAHLPMVLGSDRSKLSKRHGATSARAYREEGYLPEALINFIALLGWAPSDNKEIFSIKELIKEFSLERVQKGGAVFNIEKLDWVNGTYIRKMSVKKLTELCLLYFQKLKIKSQKSKVAIQNIKYLEKIIKLEQPRLVKLSEIAEKTDYFFEEPKYEKQLLRWKNMTDGEIKPSLEKSLAVASKIPEVKFRLKNIEKILLKEAEKIGDRGRLLWPLRVALSGKKASPGPFEIADVLGKREVLKRIKNAIKILE